MAVLKCKMCGGDIEVSEDKTFGTCDSCGSTMTFPKIDDEQKAEAEAYLKKEGLDISSLQKETPALREV